MSKLVKKYLQRFKLWLWQRLQRLATFLVQLVVTAPQKLKQAIFNFATWGKQQLDKRINSDQRKSLYTIIFESETPQGRRFDTIIIWMIVCSIIVVMLETVSEFHRAHWWIFFILEWVFTLVFTIEYILRLYASRQPLSYATSFFGLVDLLSFIPSYLGIFFVGAQNLIIIRALRLLRVFRIFKMGQFVREGEIIVSALKASQNKIYVFVTFMLLMSMIIGSVLYIIEGGVNSQLDNIPKGIYWAIVTLTTVGYGDVTPITPFGKFLAVIVMIMGYGVIAVPTGIVTAEISSRVMNMKEIEFRECPHCGQAEHHTNPTYCHNCGHPL